MNEEYIDNVKQLIEQKDANKVKEFLINLHPADIAELCNDLVLSTGCSITKPLPTYW